MGVRRWVLRGSPMSFRPNGRLLLGNGIRLFEDLDPEGIELRRTSTIDTPGATHLRSEAVKV